MKNVQDILAWCIEDIKAGRSTLEGCLAQYPSMRRQLEPLLRIALSIQEPPSIKPTNDFRIRARVQLMDYIHDKRSEKKSWITTLNTGIRQSWYSGWLKTVTIIIAIILASSALGTGTVYASKDSLPGDTLYSVKIATEHVRRFLTIDDLAKIELELKLTDIRLEEFEDLANKNPEKITLAVKGYKKNIAMAIDKVENNGDRGISAEGLEMVAIATLEHISILDRINDSVKAADKEALKQAEEIAFRAQFKVLRSLSKEDPLRATEINIETMQNRLNRASTKADEHEIMEAEDALRQFKEMFKFGDDISQIAKEFGYNTTAIDALNIQAKSSQLEIISNMFGKISEEAIASVKEVMGISVENYGKADKGSSKKGADNDIPEKSDNYSEEPRNKPAQPGDEPGEPGNGSGEPGSGSGEPGNGSGEPGSGSGEPGNGSGEPGNGSGEPGNGSGEPGNGSGEPGNGSGEPGSGSGEPGSGSGEPGSGSGEPGSGSGEPGNGYGELGSGSGEPGSGSGEPGSGSGEPGSGSGEPGNGSGEPGNGSP